MAFSLLAKKDKRVPARGNWVMIINENEQINKKIKWRIAETLKQKRNSDFYLLLWTETRFLSVFCILTYACGKKMTPPGLLQSCCEYFQVQQYWHWRLTTFCIPVRSEAKTWATFLVFRRQGRKECRSSRRNNPKLRSTMFLWSSTRFCVVNFWWLWKYWQNSSSNNYVTYNKTPGK